VGKIVVGRGMEEPLTIIARIVIGINTNDSHATKMTCPDGCAGRYKGQIFLKKNNSRRTLTNLINLANIDCER
jgi:hypothetical protein